MVKLEEQNQKLRELEAGDGESGEVDGEAATADGDGGGESKRQKIVEQYNAAKAKEHAVRLKIAKKNREISTLKRKLDEVPSRNELSQYQKRFIELYNQSNYMHANIRTKILKNKIKYFIFSHINYYCLVSGFFMQTKQFYLLYNSQEDKRMHMNKVISLYNSINDQFAQ